MSDAVMVGLFTLGGVTLSSLITWLTAFLNSRRESTDAAQKQENRDRIRVNDLRREGVVGVAHSWAQVVRADSARIEALKRGDEGPGQGATVVALTELGLNLNKLLVLPLTTGFENHVLRVDEVLTTFRDAFDDLPRRVEARQAVGDTILDLIKAARKEGTV